MFKSLLFAFTVSFLCCSYAQAQEDLHVGHRHDAKKSSAKKESTDDNVFQYVEQMPTPGYDINEYFAKHLKYPRSARRQKLEGRVIVTFVVTEIGAIKEIKVIRGICPSMDRRAIRVIKKMPHWKPARQNGKAVKVRFTQPVVFKMS